jgi:hypothetical protein
MIRPFRIVEIEAADIDQHGNALDEINSGESYSALIVRHVFSAAAMGAVVARLERGETALIGRDSPYYTGRMFGRILPHERDLDAYFAESGVFPEESQALFHGLGPDFKGRLEEVLTALAGGKVVRLARTPDGRMYQPFSIREMLPGAFIDVHFENEAFDAPPMQELLEQLDGPEQLSAYLALAVPEEGGELSVYPLRGTDPQAAAIRALDRTAESTYAEIQAIAPRAVLNTGVGDLLIFDAGRHFHRVTRVGGRRSRWTMGSFLALSRTRDAFLYFS